MTLTGGSAFREGGSWTSSVGLDSLDVSSGMVFGEVVGSSMTEGPTSGAARSADAALRDVLRGALQHEPCLVSFSGGRDSSAMLALAADVARREGLALPVPATVHFPLVEQAQETEWQREVLRHLDLEGVWHVVSVTDELDAIGEVALEGLRQHGLLYPYNAHFQVPLLEAARGGTLITGVGGDELFTEVQWWGEAIALVGNGRRPSGRACARAAARCAPRPLRVRLLAKHFRFALPWLTSLGRQRTEDRYARWLAEQPLSYSGSLQQWWWRSRYLQTGLRSLSALAADHDAMLVQPFATSEVLVALARQRPYSGFASRTEAMCQLFGALLPPPVVARESKADFTRVLLGAASRSFLDEWDGEGVDHDLVDWPAYQQAWTEPQPDGRLLLQLQASRLTAA